MRRTRETLPNPSIEAQSDAERLRLLSEFEGLGLRGLNWFLVFLREEVHSEAFCERVDAFHDHVTADQVLYFLQWVKRTHLLCSSLVEVTRAVTVSRKFSGTEDQRREKTKDLIGQLAYYWAEILSFVYKAHQKQQLLTQLKRKSIPLEAADAEYRNHFLSMFRHDLLGSRLLGSLNDALQFLKDDLAFAVENGVGEKAASYLNKLSTLIDRYTFDSEPIVRLFAGKLLAELPTLTQELKDAFPELGIEVFSFIPLEKYDELQVSVVPITIPMLRTALDNLAANAVKAGSNKVRVDVLVERTKSGLELWVTMFDWFEMESPEEQSALAPREKGFSSQHAFQQKRLLTHLVGGQGIKKKLFIRPVEIKLGHSTWVKADVQGTGIGLATLQTYIQGSEGVFSAGTLLENDEPLGGVVEFLLPITLLPQAES